jgi:hypothetical protein
MHIVYNNFEQATFGKLLSNISFIKIAYPYNIYYLVWTALMLGRDSSILGWDVPVLRTGTQKIMSQDIETFYI